MSDCTQSIEVEILPLLTELYDALALIDSVEALLEHVVDATSSAAAKRNKTEFHSWDSRVFALLRIAEQRIESTCKVLGNVPSQTLVPKGGAA